MPTRHLSGRHFRIPLPKRGKDVDMTHGNIARHIISFAFPLLIGNIFQQLYNTVDTWVVGNFVSNEAFSAVGTTGPIINILIGFFTGLAAGAGIIISQNYGAHRYDEVQKTVHTAMVMTLIMGVLFTFLGMALIPLALQVMNTPDAVIPESTAYLRIYFSGVMGLMIYNMGAGILRAVGDSTRPFYYLLVCAVMNTVLDLVFVIGFDMGVEGVALATILSQCTSALLVVIALLRTDSCVKISVAKLRLHMDMLKKIIRVGIPAAIQMAVTAFSNVFVQSYVNYFGPDCMSGWTAYSKVDQLLFLPMQSIGLAVTTFVGQNLGSNQPDRARKGVWCAIRLGLTATIILMTPMLIFPNQIVSFFNDKPEVVAYGAMLLRYMSPFYILPCFNQILSGALRGAGNTKAPTLIMLGSFVLFRQAYLFVMSRICNEIIPIAMAYPAGWILCTTISMIYFLNVKLVKTRLVDDN